MALLKFKLKDIDPIFGHILKTEKPNKLLEDIKAEALLLVKDQGIYLISNTLDEENSHGSLGLIAYAEGCSPQDEGWDNGGSDFVFPVPISWYFTAVLNGQEYFLIELDGDTIASKNPKKGIL